MAKDVGAEVLVSDLYFHTSILNSGRAACLASWQKLRCKNTLELVGNLNFKL